MNFQPLRKNDEGIVTLELCSNAHHQIHAKLEIEENDFLSCTYIDNPQNYILPYYILSSATTSPFVNRQINFLNDRWAKIGWLFFTIPWGYTDIDFVLPPTNKVWAIPRIANLKLGFEDRWFLQQLCMCCETKFIIPLRAIEICFQC